MVHAWRRAAAVIGIIALAVAAFQAGVAVGASSAAARVVTSQTAQVTPTPSARPSTGAPVAEHSDPASPAISETPDCFYGNVHSEHEPAAEWASIVLDTSIRLASSYVPPDLADTSAAGLNGGHLIRELVVEDLARLAKAARAAGAPVAIQSAYRSFDSQRQAFQHWVSTAGRKEALRMSARPGHSEHQLGTAIDFRSASSLAAPWGFRNWGKTDAGAWMLTHAWRFGFVLSYPRGSFGRTCYGYEPWHYRYVGRSVAAAIYASDLTPREWFLRAEG